MQNILVSYQVEKARAKKIKKYVAKIQADDPFTIPSFEESSSFPVGMEEGHRDEPKNVFSLGPSASSLKRTCKGVDSFFVPRTTPGSQPTVDAKWKKIEKEVAWECIARWWYDTDISFNTSNSAYFQPMIDVIATCGQGFKAPSFHNIKESLLQNEV